MTNPPTTRPPDAVKSADRQYNLVAIVRPQQNENVHSATLKVLLDINPSLFKGDSVELFMDGHKVASSSGSLKFTMHNVDRGTHELMVKVISANGEVVANSETTIVHIHRPHVTAKPAKKTFRMVIKNFFGIKSNA